MPRPFALGLATMLLALGACSSEPDFDERYEQAEKQIHTKASEIDAELREGPQTGTQEGDDDSAT